MLKTFAVAPLMDWTDRHCRYFHRLLSRRARLYTEMITAAAVVHGDRQRLLGFSAEEHPVAVQLGGNDPAQLAQAARICADFGYDEVNLNVGCPSDRVQGGAFGACLMREPEVVARCVAAMKASVAVPVTVKCRIGVDDQDPEAALDELTRRVVEAGVDGLIVHARKAWLKGLSPRENREIPPLDYDRVYRLRQAWPTLPLLVNGGITTFAQIETHLAHTDGVMLGRAAYQNPELLLQVDPVICGEPAPVAGPIEAIERLLPYIEAQRAGGVRLHQITRHLLGLFPGRPGARAFRRHLATRATAPDAGPQVLMEAVALVAREGQLAQAAA
ncbi:tRNA dihydrouridine(20/20a) synthase DusA [Chelatococcus reniformis]|uniref:tRNA-dihydrouridine(20/20a) synthase n=1 Tax=Chelatococcus reniformis TaxID=1494448 RepID=A0A916UIS5_9HYPH|nr:tRNA dihydrouridine(20/20a) synthase DusA [Chelatococcus reniformis]GGC73326.1 tRNA-dihydrouridine(20/20a) synthase [Chelatococcus reniformis]